jgi:hypothetical protein
LVQKARQLRDLIPQMLLQPLNLVAKVGIPLESRPEQGVENMALQLNVAGEALSQPLYTEASLLQIQLRRSRQASQKLQDDAVLFSTKGNQRTGRGCSRQREGLLRGHGIHSRKVSS